MAGPRPNKINTSTLKSRILNIAQTSVYQVKLQPPSSVTSFLYREADISYSRDGEDIELLCSETNLPGQSLATHDQVLDYPGVTEKMAYRKIYDDRIDFTFMVDKEYNVIQFLEGWIDYVTGGEESLSRYSHYRMNYPSQYRTDNLYITKFEKDAADKYLTYQFIGAFPISVTATPISYESSQALRCSASFSFMRYVKKRRNASSFTFNPFDFF